MYFLGFLAAFGSWIVVALGALNETGGSGGLEKSLGDYVAVGIGMKSEGGERVSHGGRGTGVNRIATSTGSMLRMSSNATSYSNESTATAPTNATLGFSQCWDQWSTYWNLLPSFSTFRETACISTSEIMTYDTTIPYTISVEDVVPYTSTLVYTYTRVIDNNGFATSTYYQTETNVISNSRSSKGTTYTTGATAEYTYLETCDRAYSTTGSLPRPSCTLPSTAITQCEKSWDSWVSVQLAEGMRTSHKSLDPAPSCTQASLAEQSCSSLKDSFVSSSLDLSYFSKILPASISTGRHGDVIHWSGGYYSKSGGNETWKWPPKTAFFGPSCTLGCGRCSIKGGTVDLLYWPPATATDSPLTVTTMGTTLVSPSLYVSYHSLYAEDGCGSKMGTTIFDTILAIPASSTLHSIWGSIGIHDEDATTDVYTSTAVFDISDLYYETVPMSIYSSQPWCAKWAYFNLWDQFNSTWWSCPHKTLYKPVIKVPEDLLRAVDPLWGDCVEAYGGVYDPPLALRPAEVEAGVTLPAMDGTSTTPAAQVPTPSPVTVPATTARPSAVGVSIESLMQSQLGPGADSIPQTLASDNPNVEDPGDEGQSNVDIGDLQEAIQSAVAAVQGERSQEDPAGPPVPTNAITIGAQALPAAESDERMTGIESIASIPSAVEVDKLDLPSASAFATFDIGGEEYTAAVAVDPESELAIGHAGTILTLDGPATVINDQAITLASNGIVVDRITHGWATTMDLSPSIQTATFEADDRVYTAIRESSVAVIDGDTTLMLGGAGVRLDGQSVSLASDGLVIDGIRYPWTDARALSTADEARAAASGSSSRQTSTSAASADASWSGAQEGPGLPSRTPTSAEGRASREHPKLIAMILMICASLVYI